MANVSRVNGFNPLKSQSGNSMSGQVNLYFIPSTNAVNTFVGDAVTSETTGDTVATGGAGLGIMSCVQAAAGNPLLGVVVGFSTNPLNLNTPQYRAASTGRYVLVADSPDLVFEVQTSNGTLALGDVGNNANFAVAAGSLTTGTSGMTLDVGTVATTATLPLKIVGFSQRVDNDNTSANSKVLVKFNNDQFAGGTGTAGV